MQRFQNSKFLTKKTTMPGIAESFTLSFEQQNRACRNDELKKAGKPFLLFLV
jgi:hypothetical protein